MQNVPHGGTNGRLWRLDGSYSLQRSINPFSRGQASGSQSFTLRSRDHDSRVLFMSSVDPTETGSD